MGMATALPSPLKRKLCVGERRCVQVCITVDLYSIGSLDNYSNISFPLDKENKLSIQGQRENKHNLYKFKESLQHANISSQAAQLAASRKGNI